MTVQIEKAREALNKAAAINRRIERLEKQLEEAKTEYEAAMEQVKLVV